MVFNEKQNYEKVIDMDADGDSIKKFNMSNSVAVAEQLRNRTKQTLKYASLITLTVQNAALSLTMRAARTQPELFITSTAVIMAELIKLISCLVMVRVDEGESFVCCLFMMKLITDISILDVFMSILTCKIFLLFNVF